MARRKEVWPGSVYATRGKLVIKGSFIPGGIIYTGMPDTSAARMLAEEKKRELYKISLLPGYDPKKRHRRLVREAWAEFEAWARESDTEGGALKNEPRLREKTITNYRLAFDVVTNRENFPLSTESIERCAKDYEERRAGILGHKNITVNTYLRQFQVFCTFCSRRPRNWIDPVELLTSFGRKAPKTPIYIFDRIEAEVILAECYRRGHEFGLLNELMYLTGARPVDVLTLDWSQVRENSVIWNNKITKEAEEAALFPEAKRLFATILRDVAKGKKRGKVFRWQYASSSHVSRDFNAVCANVEKSTLGRALGFERAGRSLKTWRTTFKDRIKSLPFQTQMSLMRHKTPDVTLTNYAHFDIEEMSVRIGDFGK